MTMLKGISLSIFLAGCLALYIAVLMLTNPTVPGVSSILTERMAYSVTVVLLAVGCCVVAGLTWSRASTMRAGTAVMTSLTLSSAFLVAVCVAIGLSNWF